MEKKTYSLSLQVLKRFQKNKILQSIILIGSWSVYFYKYYFKSKTYSAHIRTHDMDFLVPIFPKINKKINIFGLIEDLGFIMDFRGTDGYIKLVHPDLTIEFLVSEKGKGNDKPYKLPQLGINAQPLRYLDFLAKHLITVKAEGLEIKLPHPAAYVLHKFIIFKRRQKIDKGNKDLESAIRVFHELCNSNERIIMRVMFSNMHKKWQRTIIKNLENVKEYEIIDILQ